MSVGLPGWDVDPHPAYVEGYDDGAARVLSARRSSQKKPLSLDQTLDDLAERRRIGNRLAQRSFRGELRKRLEELEEGAQKLEQEEREGSAEGEQLGTQNQQFEKEPKDQREFASAASFNKSQASPVPRALLTESDNYDPSSNSTEPGLGDEKKNYVFVDEHSHRQRLKAMRACEHCRRRKIKCDAATTNEWPCAACVRLKLYCVPSTETFNGTHDTESGWEPLFDSQDDSEFPSLVEPLFGDTVSQARGPLELPPSLDLTEPAEPSNTIESNTVLAKRARNTVAARKSRQRNSKRTVKTELQKLTEKEIVKARGTNTNQEKSLNSKTEAGIEDGRLILQSGVAYIIPGNSDLVTHSLPDHELPASVEGPKDASQANLMHGSLWTKIDKKLVDPETLTMGHEQYEEKVDHVIIPRVLTQKEIEKYVSKSKETRHKGVNVSESVSTDSISKEESNQPTLSSGESPMRYDRFSFVSISYDRYVLEQIEQRAQEREQARKSRQARRQLEREEKLKRQKIEIERRGHFGRQRREQTERDPRKAHEAQRELEHRAEHPLRRDTWRDEANNRMKTCLLRHGSPNVEIENSHKAKERILKSRNGGSSEVSGYVLLLHTLVSFVFMSAVIVKFNPDAKVLSFIAYFYGSICVPRVACVCCQYMKGQYTRWGKDQLPINLSLNELLKAILLSIKESSIDAFVLCGWTILPNLVFGYDAVVLGQIKFVPNIGSVGNTSFERQNKITRLGSPWNALWCLLGWCFMRLFFPQTFVLISGGRALDRHGFPVRNMQPQSSGKERVRGQCRCGYRFVDEFTEVRPAAAAYYENLLQERSCHSKDYPYPANPDQGLQEATDALEMYKSELVDIRKLDDLPPEEKKDEYRYNPVPADIIPPVGENHMLHLINHPTHAEEDGFVLDRIPKKLKERLLVPPHVGLVWAGVSTSLKAGTSPEEVSSEGFSPEVREAGKADPGTESASPEKTVGRLEDHVEDADLRSKVLDSGQDQTKVRSNNSMEYKDLGSSIDWSKTEKFEAILKDEKADRACIEAGAAAVGENKIADHIAAASNAAAAAATEEAEKKAQEALAKAKEEAEAAAAKANEEAKVVIAKAAEEAAAEARVEVYASAAAFPYIPRKSQRVSLSSSSPKAAIGSLQSEETSDDEESEMVTPEVARKIVNDLLAEYTTLIV
ncbi:hypothetical protein G7Y79_00006g018470 [Physcia stellaris]|nr:hypothetical protein G7Y79_00006g018470 [Physcia stellaris]